MDDGSTVALIISILTAVGTSAGAALMWYQKYKARRDAGALKRERDATQSKLNMMKETARAEGEVESVRTKQGQKDADWAIKRYEGMLLASDQRHGLIIKGLETRIGDMDEKIEEQMKREIKCREDLSSAQTELRYVRAENDKLKVSFDALSVKLSTLQEKVGRLERDDNGGPTQ